MVLLDLQYLSNNRKFGNKVIVQYMRIDDAAGLQYRQDAGEVCSNVSEGMYLPERAGTISQGLNHPFSVSFI